MPTSATPSRVGVYVIQGQRYVYVNPGMCELFGYSRDELLALTNVAAGVSRDDRELVSEQIRRREAGEIDTVRYSFRARHKDGRMLDIEVHGSETTFQGERAVTGMMLDVTERKAAERALRDTQAQLLHAQKMEVVGTLAGGVAHDFNNFLTVVAGHSDRMLRDLPPADQMIKRVTAIRAATDRAAALTRQLLTFGRRDAADPRVLLLPDLLTRVEKVLPRLIGEHIRVVVETAETDGRIEADADQLEQVLMNLASNARDAMPEGGTLRLAVTPYDAGPRFVERHPEATIGPYVLLTVADSGVGMDAQTMQHVFEPFFTTKEPGKGTGLGLSTAFAIVRSADGIIELDSAPGEGTRFRLYFPEVEGVPEAVETDTSEVVMPSPTAEANEVILVVEDQADVRELLEEWLGELGYQTLVAGSGDEAIRLVEADDMRVDLVLSDVVMPGMSGPELVDRLSRRFPDVRSLYMSGYARDMLDQPGVRYLAKPFSLIALSRQLRDVLG